MALAYSSESAGPVEINSVDELHRFLDEAESQARFPTAVTIEAHDYRADLLVGHASSFVHLTPLTEDAPYFVTVGDAMDGMVDFWLLGVHHTQFECRHLVPRSSARQALAEFLVTGRRSSVLCWEEYSA